MNEGKRMSIDARNRAQRIFDDSAAAHQRFLESGMESVIAAAEAISKATLGEESCWHSGMAGARQTPSIWWPNSWAVSSESARPLQPWP